MTDDERARAKMRSVWLEITHLWANELRRLGRDDAADKVMALSMKEDFSGQLANERVLRETFWALPPDHRKRLDELDRRFVRVSHSLVIVWSRQRRRSGWSLSNYADEAQRALEAWREELERAA